ncbi:MAG: DMT family transporter [Rhabdochlamydiaceae bacterium]|jgi:drug/metabolite transporter (DMT)-like permease
MSVPADGTRQLQNRAVLGISLMILGLALYPLADAFVKHLMGIYSVPQASFLRALTRLLPLLVTMFFQGGIKKVLGTQYPGKHAVRLVVNLAYTLCFMFATKMLTLTTVYTIGYTSSLFMIILSAVMLKESVKWDRWLAVGIGMVGVVVAMRPGSNVFELAALLVLVGAFLGSLNKILMRRLAATEHSLAIAIYPNIMMMLATAPFLITTWKSMPWEHWGLFAIVGLITAGGQYAIAQAMRFAQGSVLAPVDYSNYFWVVAFDFFWWNKMPDMWMVLGAAIIVGSNFYILYRTRQEQALSKVAAAK